MIRGLVSIVGLLLASLWFGSFVPAEECGLFRKVLLGISCRDYEAAVEAVPGAIGLSKSTVSREFKKATARQLADLEVALGGREAVPKARRSSPPQGRV